MSQQPPWQPPPPPQGQQQWTPGAPPQWNAPPPQQPQQYQQPMGWTLANGDQAPRQQQEQPQQPAGYDPLGQQDHASVSIDDYQLPKSRSRLWLGAAAVVVVGALAAAAIWTSGRPQPTPVDSPSPTPSQRVLPSSVPSGNAVAFASQSDGAQGYWEIKESNWTDRGLELLVKVTVTEGTFGFTFFALDNATVEDFDPANIPDSDVLRPGTLGAGESAEGRVVFNKDQGATMVYLANRYGRQVSALAVEG
ncbi:hypothetical protein [Aestuariimicrobium sp. Y1814]|uniref:hypothetical protein n=1 Tax=Aestuariimicrobium sp. Y1814 TaxID=3418742 RepID=UPI003DA6F84A